MERSLRNCVVHSRCVAGSPPMTPATKRGSSSSRVGADDGPMGVDSSSRAAGGAAFDMMASAGGGAALAGVASGAHPAERPRASATASVPYFAPSSPHSSAYLREARPGHRVI